MINILLVEDDEVNVMNVKREFKKVKVTNSLFVCCYQWNRLGNEQASKVPAKPSLILLNLNMLKMKGRKNFFIIGNREQATGNRE